MRKALIGTAGALVLLIVALVAWRTVRNSAPPPAAPPPLPVAVQAIDYCSVSNELQAVGSLRAMRAVALAAETARRVTAIVTLFDACERADIAAAKARAAFPRIQLQRSKELAPSGAEPRELLQQRQAEYVQALVALQRSRRA